MPSEKDRLYVALYIRGGAPKMPGLEDTYHWGFITGPKTESKDSRGYLIHAKETLAMAGNPPSLQAVWGYENKKIGLAPTSRMLVRIVVAKIKNTSRLHALFASTPLRPDEPGWNCVGWVKEALKAAMKDDRALGTSAKD